MSLGEQSYKMRLTGMMWKDIATILRCQPNFALSAAEKHARNNDLTPLSGKRGQKLLPPVRKQPKKGDAQRWDKMHCGKGMRATDIAKKEHVDVELVRKTLKAYREKMWG